MLVSIADCDMGLFIFLHINFNWGMAMKNKFSEFINV